jgi:hypothetical protein
MAGFCRPWLRSGVTFAFGCVPSAWEQGPGRSIGEYFRGHRCTGLAGGEGHPNIPVRSSLTVRIDRIVPKPNMKGRKLED